MTRALALIAMTALPAQAQDAYRWTADTFVVIQQTAQPGAFAEVVFTNTEIHTQFGYAFDLTYDGVTVSITMDINAQGGAADRMTVTPPPGFIAVPPELTVPENGAGVIYIMMEELS